MSEQFLFDFQAAPKADDALLSWREHRAKEADEVCRRLGLPLGKNSEVRLKSGTTLRGVLRLADEMLWMEANRKTVILRIEEATFHVSEIAAAIRADDALDV